MEKIGTITGWCGTQDVFKYKSDRTLIPVNEGARFAKDFITKEDWVLINEAADQEDKTTLKLSVGPAIYRITEHPEGADRGGYVKTIDFKNVDQYCMGDVNNISSGASMHLDEQDNRWL